VADDVVAKEGVDGRELDSDDDDDDDDDDDEPSIDWLGLREDRREVWIRSNGFALSLVVAATAAIEAADRNAVLLMARSVKRCNRLEDRRRMRSVQQVTHMQVNQ
jgi:hypothetical protein